MQAVANGTLAETEVEFSTGSACCVVIASKGYPVSYQSGFEMELPEPAQGEYIFVAGAKKEGEKLLSAGGRVLGVTATAENLPAAIDKAYALANKVKFENGFMRGDIGQRALKAYKE